MELGLAIAFIYINRKNKLNDQRTAENTAELAYKRLQNGGEA